METPLWLKEMPKTDLHCHLGGSIRIKTVIELAKENKVKLPTYNPEELRRYIVCTNMPEKSLSRYLDAFKITESVFKKPRDFERVAFEICEDAHAENVKILELRFAPTRYEHENLKLYQIIEATLAGLRRGADTFKIQTGLIICGIRTQPENVKRAIELAVAYHGRGVVGFDLAGKESGYRPKTFENIIMPALNNFIPVTIHAGEDDSVASIAEALIYLNAQRVGHGTALLESSKLLEYVNKTRTAIEVCPTSNVDTGAVSSLDTHPIRRFYQEDLRVCICTDNRTISDTNITKEYLLLIKHLGFTPEMIFKLAKDGIKSAFVHSSVAKHYLNEFDRYLAKINKRF